MPQIFPRSANAAFRLGLALAAGSAVGAAAVAWVLARSDAAWGIGQPAEQPIPFSHAIHAGDIGLDCRYCHATVERAADAGMPTAELCLGCHSRIWASATVLAPLHDSVALGAPIVWASVHRLPDHARFHHGAHLAADVGCTVCHGEVRAMPRTVKTEPMSMGWCLGCHRTAGPKEHPTGIELLARIAPHPPELADCTTCHR